MKISTAIILLLIFSMMVIPNMGTSFAQNTSARDLDGTWQGTWQSHVDTPIMVCDYSNPITITLSQNGNYLTGTATLYTGTVSGDASCVNNTTETVAIHFTTFASGYSGKIAGIPLEGSFTTDLMNGHGSANINGAITSFNFKVSRHFTDETNDRDVTDTKIPDERQTPSSLDYSIDGGKVLSITPYQGEDYESLIIAIEATNDGQLTITLPRALIDAKIDGDDDTFFVLLDGDEVEFGEEITSTARILTIDFEDGGEEIEIIGTYLNPDFLDAQNGRNLVLEAIEVGTRETESQDFVTFTSDEYGFSIDYPTNWYVDDELFRYENIIYYVVFSPKYKGTITSITISKHLDDVDFRGLSTEQYLEKMVSSLEEQCNNASYDNNNYVCSNFVEVHSDTMIDDYGNTWYFTTTSEHNVNSDGSETNVATILYEMPYGDDTWVIEMLFDEYVFNMFESKIEVDDFIETVTTSFVLTDTSSTPSTPTTTSSSGNEDNGGCLIATATFGSELAPQVQFLREIRDNTVLSTKSGTSFMTAFNSFYYSFSPTVADLERQNPVFKETVKVAITPLISTLSILQYVDIDSEQAMLGYGISIILLNIGMYFVVPAILILKLKPILRTKRDKLGQNGTRVPSNSHPFIRKKMRD